MKLVVVAPCGFDHERAREESTLLHFSLGQLARAVGLSPAPHLLGEDASARGWVPVAERTSSTGASSGREMLRGVNGDRLERSCSQRRSSIRNGRPRTASSLRSERIVSVGAQEGRKRALHGDRGL
jgi:hypothetical protein